MVRAGHRCQTRRVDWYLDSHQPEAVPLLRHEAVAYLRRHADEDASDLDAAELLLAEAVGNAVRHASGPIWVSLSWVARQPTLVVYDPVSASTLSFSARSAASS